MTMFDFENADAERIEELKILVDDPTISAFELGNCRRELEQLTQNLDEQDGYYVTLFNINY